MNLNNRRDLALKAAAQAQFVRDECKIAWGRALDPVHVAEKRKCEVRFMSLPSLEGVYSPKPRPVVIIGSQRPSGRRAYTCAHELGHHEFKHGARIEELNIGQSKINKSPDEYLADMFASFLLMPQHSIRRALKERGNEANELDPMQIFRLACYFGVGYSTIIDHMTWTLRLLPPTKRERLLRTQPKTLKAQFGGSPQSEVVIVDNFWRDRAVDLEIGDILVVNRGVVIENSPRLIPNGNINGQQTFKATSKGYTRAFDQENDWAANIRIASKHYEGLARYRFFNDPEEDIL